MQDLLETKEYLEAYLEQLKDFKHVDQEVNEKIQELAREVIPMVADAINDLALQKKWLIFQIINMKHIAYLAFEECDIDLDYIAKLTNQ